MQCTSNYQKKIIIKMYNCIYVCAPLYLKLTENSNLLNNISFRKENYYSQQTISFSQSNNYHKDREILLISQIQTLYLLILKMKNLSIDLQGHTEKIRHTQTFAQLRNKIVSLFPTLKDYNWDFCYIDNDDDIITIQEEVQYEDFIEHLNSIKTILHCKITKKQALKEIIHDDSKISEFQQSSPQNASNQQEQYQSNKSDDSHSSEIQSNEQPVNLSGIRLNKHQPGEVSLVQLQLSGQKPQTGNERQKNQNKQKEQKTQQKQKIVGNNIPPSKNFYQVDQCGPIQIVNAQIPSKSFQEQAMSVNENNLSHLKINQQDAFAQKQIKNNELEDIVENQYGSINPSEHLEANMIDHQSNQSNVELASLKNAIEQQQEHHNLRQLRVQDQRVYQEQNKQKLVSIPQTMYYSMKKEITELKKTLQEQKSKNQSMGLFSSNSNPTQKCLFCNGVKHITRPYIMFNNLTICYQCDTKFQINLKKRPFIPVSHRNAN